MDPDWVDVFPIKNGDIFGLPPRPVTVTNGGL